MDSIQKKLVEEYQCPGCVCGSDVECYEDSKCPGSLDCSAHVAGTMIAPGVGRIFLGLPAGFNRLGMAEKTKISIFRNWKDIQAAWSYDTFNVPVWKYLDERGNTLVRGLSPRINNSWIHVLLGDHRLEINCLEISKTVIENMD